MTCCGGFLRCCCAGEPPYTAGIGFPISCVPGAKEMCFVACCLPRSLLALVLYTCTHRGLSWPDGTVHDVLRWHRGPHTAKMRLASILCIRRECALWPAAFRTPCCLLCCTMLHGPNPRSLVACCLATPFGWPGAVQLYIQERIMLQCEHQQSRQSCTARMGWPKSCVSGEKEALFVACCMPLC